MSQAKISPRSYSPQWDDFFLPLNLYVDNSGSIQYFVTFSLSVWSFFVPKNESIFSVLQTSPGQPIPPRCGRTLIFPVRHRSALPSSGSGTPTLVSKRATRDYGCITAANTPHAPLSLDTETCELVQPLGPRGAPWSWCGVDLCLLAPISPSDPFAYLDPASS